MSLKNKLNKSLTTTMVLLTLSPTLSVYADDVPEEMQDIWDEMEDNDVRDIENIEEAQQELEEDRTNTELQGEDIQDLIEAQEHSLEELMDEISRREKEIFELIGELEEVELEIEELQSDINEKNEEIEEMESLIDETTKELEEKIDIYEANLEIAKSRAKTLQTNEEGTFGLYIDAVMGAEGLSDILGRMNAVRTVIGAHNDFMEGVMEQATEIEEMKISLQEQNDALNEERSEIEEMEVAAKERQEELEEEQESIETLAQELEEEREAVRLAYEDNLDEMESINETLEGQELFAEMLEAESERRAEEEEVLALLIEEMERAESSGDAVVTTSSSGTDLTSRIRSGRRDPEVVSQVLQGASEQMGVPYVWGGTSPSGFDCSGLVQYVYRDAGINLPRTSQQQAQAGTPVSLSNAQPGDLLFWSNGGRVYHVAIYIGGGEYIHTPRPGRNVSIGNVRSFTPSSARRVVDNVSTENAAEWDSSNNNNVSTNQQNSSSSESRGDLIGEFRATSYAVGDGLTPNTFTRDGTDVSNSIHGPDGHRIIATDPSVIPLGTTVRVVMPNGEEFTATARDTGSAINGNIIDVLVSSPNEARQFGRQSGIRVYSVD